jgi:hypothetical protein
MSVYEEELDPHAGCAAKIHRLQGEVTRLEKLVFVPGMMKCAKCGFVGMHMVMRASDGAVGVKTDVAPEKCPNGCGPLWRVTERDSGNEVCDRLEKSVLREKALEDALQQIADLDKHGGYNTACEQARRAIAANKP